MDDWTTVTKATKTENPNATAFATFHATEIWSEDLVEANRWLPDHCLIRNVQPAHRPHVRGVPLARLLSVQNHARAGLDVHPVPAVCQLQRERARLPGGPFGSTTFF